MRFGSLRLDRIPNYREVGDVTDLIESIKKNGLLYPLLVKTRKENDKEVYDIVDGERRFRAISAIREEEPRSFDYVPVRYYRGNEDDALFVRFETAERSKRHSPADVADFVVIMRNRNHKISDISSRIRRSEAWIYDALRIREKCCKKVLDALAEGLISFAAAKELSALDEKEQPAKLSEYIKIRKEKGTKAAKRHVNRRKAPTLSEVKALYSDARMLCTPEAEAKGANSKEYFMGVADAIEWMKLGGSRPDIDTVEEKALEELRAEGTEKKGGKA